MFFLRCNAGFVVRNVNCPNSKLMAKEVNCCPCCSGKIPFWCRKGNEKGRTAKFNSAFCLPQWENHRWWSIANHFWWASIYCMVKHSVFCGVADHQLINHFRSCVAQLSGAGFLFGWTIAILHLLSSMDSTVTRQWISLVACLPTAVQHDDVNHLDLIPLQCRELYDHQKLQFVDPHPYLAESSKW